MHIAYP